MDFNTDMEDMVSMQEPLIQLPGDKPHCILLRILLASRITSRQRQPAVLHGDFCKNNFFRFWATHSRKSSNSSGGDGIDSTVFAKHE